MGAEVLFILILLGIFALAIAQKWGGNHNNNQPVDVAATGTTEKTVTARRIQEKG